MKIRVLDVTRTLGKAGRNRGFQPVGPDVGVLTMFFFLFFWLYIPGACNKIAESYDSIISFFFFTIEKQAQLPGMGTFRLQEIPLMGLVSGVVLRHQHLSPIKAFKEPIGKKKQPIKQT